MGKKIVLAIGFGFVLALYTTFVLESLWNWFVVPALHTPEIPFWVMYGMVLLVGLFIGERENIKEELRFKALTIIMDTLLEACVPADARKELEQSLKFEADLDSWMVPITGALSRVVANTFTLALGWAVHTFLA